ncbi:MAG: hypothetical protein HGA23_04725 [Bacteroidales bacterium]|nr:hypothetical protein [Bacteroidales bacterium]
MKSLFGSLALASCVIGSMLAAIWVGITSSIDTKPTSQKLWHAIIALIIGFVLAFGCFPSAAYGVSEPPPMRTQIIPSYLLMVGVLVGGYLFGEWLGNRGYRSNLIQTVLLVPACMFILVSSWGEISFLASIHQDHVSFAQKWDWVDAKIKRAVQSGEEEVFIPSMKNWAGLEYPSQ